MDETRLANRSLSLQAEKKEFLLYCVEIIVEEMRIEGYCIEELEISEVDGSYNAYISFTDSNYNKRMAIEESELPKYFIKKINVRERKLYEDE